MSPYYEYKCESCGSEFTVTWDTFDGGPEYQPCVRCKDRAHKVLSTVFHKNKKKGKP